MARKNKMTATRHKGIKEIINLDGKKEYLVSFTYQGTRWASEKNFTRLYPTICTTANKTKEMVEIVKAKISNGEDPFTITTNKIEELVLEYLAKRNKDYKRNSTFTYNRWIKPVIGHKFIEKVTQKDIEKIKQNMIDNKDKQGNIQQSLKPSTIKKVKNILSPIFKSAHNRGLIKINVLLEVPMRGNETKPRLEERLHGSIKENVQKIFKQILVLEEDKNDEEYKCIFLISIMCARRLGEILLIKYGDIENGVVNVRGITTKTNKDYGEKRKESYPLPTEVKNILKKRTGKEEDYIFKHRVRSCMDIYGKMIDNKCDLKLKPLGKEFPIRTHENRHFIMSLCAEKFGIDNVGHLVLSHSNKSNMNDVYLSTEFDRVKKVLNFYWKLLRSK